LQCWSADIQGPAKVRIPDFPDIGMVAGNRVENERPGTCQDLVCITEREYCSDASPFPTFPSDLDGQLNNQLADTWRRTAKT